MSDKETGGNAFAYYDGLMKRAYDGMTLRDYFAAKAMNAFMTDETIVWSQDTMKIGAKKAYEMADEMLKARNE